MRSIVINAVLFLVGAFLVALGGGLWLQARRDGIWDAFPVIFGTVYLSLGLWCAVGAVRNFRNLAQLRLTPLTPGDRLIKWYLGVLAVTSIVYVTVLSLHSASAPFGLVLMIMHYSVIALFAAIPFVLITALSSRIRSSDQSQRKQSDQGE